MNYNQTFTFHWFTKISQFIASLIKTVFINWFIIINLVNQFINLLHFNCCIMKCWINYFEYFARLKIWFIKFSSIMHLILLQFVNSFSYFHLRVNLNQIYFVAFTLLINFFMIFIHLLIIRLLNYYLNL